MLSANWIPVSFVILAMPGTSSSSLSDWENSGLDICAACLTAAVIVLTECSPSTLSQSVSCTVLNAVTGLAGLKSCSDSLLSLPKSPGKLALPPSSAIATSFARSACLARVPMSLMSALPPLSPADSVSARATAPSVASSSATSTVASPARSRVLPQPKVARLITSSPTSAHDPLPKTASITWQTVATSVSVSAIPSSAAATGGQMNAKIRASTPSAVASQPQTVAAALEGMALTLTEVATVCQVILAVFGKGSWADVGLDVISLATFGWGRTLLRAGDATVEVADELATEGAVARADTLSAGLSGGNADISDIGTLARQADRANDVAIAEEGGKASLPGLFGKLSKESLQDFKPASPVTAFKTVQDTDWESVLGEHSVKTITAAVRQAAHISSPEFSQSLKELDEVPGIAKITKLTGIQFADSITRYGQLWTKTQAAALGIDAFDKLDSVLNYFDIHIPGYDQAKEHVRT